MTTITKEFDAVSFMRAQREKLSSKLSKMTKQEILAYFNSVKLKASTKPCA